MDTIEVRKVIFHSNAKDAPLNVISLSETQIVPAWHLKKLGRKLAATSECGVITLTMHSLQLQPSFVLEAAEFRIFNFIQNTQRVSSSTKSYCMIVLQGMTRASRSSILPSDVRT